VDIRAGQEFLDRRMIFTHARNQTPVPRLSSLIITLTETSWFLEGGMTMAEQDTLHFCFEHQYRFYARSAYDSTCICVIMSVTITYRS
jgi:hypothetical protein